MREPAFWWRKGRGSLLAPFAAIYGAVAWGRIQAQGKPAGVPVILRPMPMRFITSTPDS